MFQLSGRPDMTEMIQSFLGSKADDLKGLDRTRPLGVMIFLEDSLPPVPVQMIYLPVQNEADLIGTLRLGGEMIRQTGEHDYELGAEKSGNPVRIRVEQGYAFVLPMGDEFLHGQSIPDPEVTTRGLSERYDVAISFDLRGIPPLIRNVFGSFFTQQSAAQMQQRDHESDASYQLRRAQAIGSLQWMEQLIRDGELVTLGLDSVADGRRAALELTIQAVPDSPFAKTLTGMSGKSSSFSALLQDRDPLQISASWMLDKREKESLTALLQSARFELNTKVTEAAQPAVKELIDIAQATVDHGHIDGMLKLHAYREQEFVLLAGLQVQGSEALGGALRSVATAMSEQNPDLKWSADAHRAQEISFMKLQLSRPSNGLKRICGGTPDLYFGTGRGTCWMALGCGGVPATLDHAVEAVRRDRSQASLPATATTAPTTTTTAPFSLVVHAASWLKLPARRERNEARLEAFREAVSPEIDSVRLEITPQENGVRTTLRFEEGFVRLLGMQLAELYDRTQL
jgi:hypothetical protein